MRMTIALHYELPNFDRSQFLHTRSDGNIDQCIEGEIEVKVHPGSKQMRFGIFYNFTRHTFTYDVGALLANHM